MPCPEECKFSIGPSTPHATDLGNLRHLDANVLEAQLSKFIGRLEMQLAQANAKLDDILKYAPNRRARVSLVTPCEEAESVRPTKPTQRQYVRSPGRSRNASPSTDFPENYGMDDGHEFPTQPLSSDTTTTLSLQRHLSSASASKVSFHQNEKETDLRKSIPTCMADSITSDRSAKSPENSPGYSRPIVGHMVSDKKSAIQNVFGNLSEKENIRRTIAASKSDSAPGGLASELSLEPSWCDCQFMAWQFLEDPTSSVAATVFSKSMSTMICISCVLNFTQTIKPPPLKPETFVPIEMLFDAVFLGEVVLRFVAAPNKLRFFLSTHNVIDIVGSGPPLVLRFITMYVLDRSDTTDEIRYVVLCMNPVLRMLKMLRRWSKFHLLISSGTNLIIEVMPVLLVMMFLMAIFFASLIYFVEPRDNIDALPKALWMTIVTMTTVGYGDTTPKSTAGHLITSVLVISSALYMAVPLGIVGNAFSQVWEDRDWLYLVQHAHDRLIQNGYTAMDIPHIFKMFGNEEGELAVEDFFRMIIEMRLGIREDRILTLFSSFDTDRSGTIDSTEFIRAVFPSQYAKMYGQTNGSETMSSKNSESSNIPSTLGSNPALRTIVKRRSTAESLSRLGSMHRNRGSPSRLPSSGSFRNNVLQRNRSQASGHSGDGTITSVNSRVLAGIQERSESFSGAELAGIAERPSIPAAQKESVRSRNSSENNVIASASDPDSSYSSQRQCSPFA